MKKMIAFIVVVVIVVMGVLVISHRNNYKLEMDYTKSNIKHFVRGIESHGNSLDIEIEDIDVYSSKSATAHLYVKHSIDKAVNINIYFEYGHDGWNENGYEVEVRCVDPDYGRAATAAIAEAIELMLADETRVQQNFDQHFGESYASYTYKIGSYYCRCSYSVMMGNNFYYTITTHTMNINS